MSDTPATPAAGKKKWSTTKKIVVGLVILIVIAGIVLGGSMYIHNKSIKEMASLIDKAAGEYPDHKDKVSKLIADTASEIISSREERSLAKKYSREMGITYEQAVIDMSLGRLRGMKYIE